VRGEAGSWIPGRKALTAGAKDRTRRQFTHWVINSSSSVYACSIGGMATRSIFTWGISKRSVLTTASIVDRPIDHALGTDCSAPLRRANANHAGFI
jgi:hypothetical protein